MKEFKQYKLWRDKSLDWVLEHGTIANWRRLDDADFDKKLREKLCEEAAEVLAAKSLPEMTEELADVFEVIDNLLDLHKLTKEDIFEAQKHKKELRGGFSGRKFVETTKHPLGSWQEAYCLKSPEKYPLMNVSESFAQGSPRPAARAVIICEGKVLFMKDEKYLTLPGGGIEFKESAAAALKRELKEEIGVTLPLGRFLGCFEQHFIHDTLGDIHDLSFIFLSEVSPQQKAQISSQEACYSCAWIAIDELKKVDVAPEELSTLIPTWLAHNVDLALKGSFVSA